MPDSVRIREHVRRWPTSSQRRPRYILHVLGLGFVARFDHRTQHTPKFEHAARLWPAELDALRDCYTGRSITVLRLEDAPTEQ